MQTLVKAIAASLAQADPDHADTYQTNADNYINQLMALDAEYTQAISQVDNPTLLFGDRFPFRYLMDDYGITYYAAFSGCSAETEASFQTIAFLSDKLDELKLPSVIKLDGADGKIADAIIRTSQSRDQQVLQLHAMQSISAQDVKNGASYLDIMKDNLAVIRQALEM